MKDSSHHSLLDDIIATIATCVIMLIAATAVAMTVGITAELIVRPIFTYLCGA